MLSIKLFNSLFLNEYEIDESLVLWDGFIATLCAQETNEPMINFQDLLMSVALALVHLNRSALAEGENPMTVLAKIQVPA